MYSIEVKESDLPVLATSRYRHPVLTVQKRMQVIYSLGLGIQDYGLVAKLAGVHRDTVTDYIKLYNSKGLEGLQEVGFVGRASDLRPHQGSLEAYFKEHPVNSISEGREKIMELTGIEKKNTQAFNFF